jgi:hypothetical protein
MADQNNSGNEFVFEEEVNQDQAEYSKSTYEGSTENIKSLIHNKRLMMTLGAIVGLWVITYLVEASMSSGSVEDTIDEDLAMVKQELGENPPAAAPQVPVVPQVSRSDLHHVESTVSSNAAGVQKISNDVAQQNMAIEKSLKNYNDLNAKVAKMANQLDNLQYQMKHALDIDRELYGKIYAIEDKMRKAEEAKKLAEEKKMPKKPLAIYHLRAIVDGRAWLVSPAGESLTVVVGESLTDYGKVTNIFASQGLISTSSGRVIQFAHD